VSGPDAPGRCAALPLAAALVGVGFTALLYQVILTRELIVSFVGNELIIGIILLAWLLLVAAGSAAGARLPDRRVTVATLAGTELALAPLMAGGLVLARLAGEQGDFPGEIASPTTALVLTAASLAPACLVLGAQFALGCKLLERAAPRAAGRVYVLEATGAVASGVLFHFVIADHLSSVVAVAALVAGNCALAAWLSAGGRSRVTPAAACALGAIFLVPVGWPGLAHRVDGALIRVRSRRDVVAWTNTRYGLWTIGRAAGQLACAHDGVPLFTDSPEPGAEIVHIGLAAHPEPRRVLLIGGGPPAIREALKHPVERLDYAELDREGIRFIARHVPEELARPLRDPRVHLRFTDGRALVKASRRAWDVIVTDLPDPTTAVINRYYTRGFFTEAARALRPGGVLLTGLSSPRATLTGERRLLVGGVWRALSRALPSQAVLPVQESLQFLATLGPPVDVAGLPPRLGERDLDTLFVTPYTLEAELNPLALAIAGEAVEGAAADAPENTDFRPIAYHLQMRLWWRQFAPREELGWLDAVTARSVRQATWIAVALALIAALVAGRRRGFAPVATGLAIALIGLLEMGVQLAVLFAFQTIAGYLYHQIGLLMTLNMLGLAVGAWLAGRLPGRRSGAILAGICALFALVCAGMPWLMRAAAAAPPFATALLGSAALLASLLTGAAFPAGVALSGGAQSRAGARLYALDLVGGALGAAAVSIVLVPLTGLDVTAGALAVLAVAALALLVPAALQARS